MSAYKKKDGYQKDKPCPYQITDIHSFPAVPFVNQCARKRADKKHRYYSKGKNFGELYRGAFSAVYKAYKRHLAQTVS